MPYFHHYLNMGAPGNVVTAAEFGISPSVADNTPRIQAAGRVSTVGGVTVSGNRWYMKNDNSSGAVTLPAASDAEGQTFLIEATGAGASTISRTGGDTINGAAADGSIASGSLAIVVSDGVSDWRLFTIG